MAAGRSILIVEDHTMVAEYLASILGGAGYEPVQATSLARARALLAQRRFDLWLCDRHLPDGSGIDLLAARAQYPHRDVPALALTAQLDGNERAALQRAGFADALAKPCTPERLLAAIAVLFDPTAPAAAPAPVDAAPDMPWPAPALDDDAALRICGNRGTLLAMRRLFAADLAALRPRLAQLRRAGDQDALASELHKLAAAAAWCGASELGAAASQLKFALPERDPSAEWCRLDMALIRTGDALDA